MLAQQGIPGTVVVRGGNCRRMETHRPVGPWDFTSWGFH